MGIIILSTLVLDSLIKELGGVVVGLWLCMQELQGSDSNLQRRVLTVFLLVELVEYTRNRDLGLNGEGLPLVAPLELSSP